MLETMMRWCLSFAFLVAMVMPVGAQSYFSIVDDDADNVEAVSSVKRVADRRGVKVSFAVIAERLRDKEKLISLLLDYQRQGHGICNHSFSHNIDFWSHPTEEKVEWEMERSEAVLDSLGFSHHDYFVYPFGTFPASTYQWLVPLASAHYRMALGCRGYGNDLNAINRYNIARLPLRKHDNMFVVKHIIDEAVEKNQWLVFLNHSGMARDYSEERLDEVIAYCQAKGMRNVTIYEADSLNLLKNNNSSVSEWTRSDEVLYLLYMHIGWVLLAAVICVAGGLYVWKLRRR